MQNTYIPPSLTTIIIFVRCFSINGGEFVLGWAGVESVIQASSFACLLGSNKITNSIPTEGIWGENCETSVVIDHLTFMKWLMNSLQGRHAEESMLFIINWCEHHTTITLVSLVFEIIIPISFIQINSNCVSPKAFWENQKKDEIVKYQKSSSKHVLPVVGFES